MAVASLPELPLDAGSDTNELADDLRRAVAAVRVGFTWWGTHRTLTARQKEELGEGFGAESRLLSAGKRIVDVRHEAFRALTSLRSRVVAYWRGLTLPYVEPGVRLIRRADVAGFDAAMGQFKEQLAGAEAGLDRAYAQIRDDARRRLGRLYDPADYPSAVRGLFGVDWDFPSVEPPGYLVRLAPEVYEQERQRVARRFAEAVALAEEAFTAEFAKLVSHLAERLRDEPNGERRVFRDSAVGNLTEFFERFAKLSVRSSPELDRLVEQARDLVRGVTPTRLRENGSLRRHVAAEMADVQARLEGMLVERPRRLLVRSRPGAGGDRATGH